MNRRVTLYSHAGYRARQSPWNPQFLSAMPRSLAAFAAALVALATAAPHAQPVLQRDAQVTDAALRAAAERGVLLRGIDDVEALRTVLTEMVRKDASVRRAAAEAAVEARAAGTRVRPRQVERPAAGDAPRVRLPDVRRLPDVALRVPPNLARDAVVAAGVDARAVADLAARVPTDLAVYRVEFLRGFDPAAVDAAADGGAPYRDPMDPGGLDDGDFTPGFPSPGSLVGNITGWSEVNEGGVNTVTVHFSDGSIAQHTRVRAGGDAGVSQDRYVAVDGDGTVSYFFEITKNMETGETNASEASSPGTASGGTDCKKCEARFFVRERIEEEQQGADAPDADAPDADAPDPEKYQPADGGGVLCPLAVEICRRQMQDALDSRGEALVGAVFVNPGDPDDQPEAARLVFDPQGLVINPDPNVAAANSARDPSTFRMVLPVHVLPPRPGTGPE